MIGSETSMTRILVLLGLAAMALAGGSASAAPRTVTLALENMYCAACPYIVKRSLAGVPGVVTIVVSFDRKTATVTYDDGKATVATLTGATTEAGYPSKVVP
jgi:mercuric ion binding protein